MPPLSVLILVLKVPYRKIVLKPIDNSPFIVYYNSSKSNEGQNKYKHR